MAAYQLYDTGLTVTQDDELLSLSTCEYSSTNGRLIVLAKRRCKDGKKRVQKDQEFILQIPLIVVKMEGLGEIGHVANSAHTVIGESMSAGRIYDKIGDTAKAKVVLVTPQGTICSLSKKSLINNKYMNVKEN